MARWNPADFMAMKSTDFMKFGGFHGKDLYTACIYLYFDKKYSILVVDHEFHGKDLYICIGSDEKYSILVVDHEIWWISWNPADFIMKSGEFHEIQRISSMKSGGFHGWSWKMQTWKCKIFLTLITFFLCKPNQRFLWF